MVILTAIIYAISVASTAFNGAAIDQRPDTAIVIYAISAGAAFDGAAIGQHRDAAIVIYAISVASIAFDGAAIGQRSDIGSGRDSEGVIEGFCVRATCRYCRGTCCLRPRRHREGSDTTQCRTE